MLHENKIVDQFRGENQIHELFIPLWPFFPYIYIWIFIAKYSISESAEKSSNIFFGLRPSPTVEIQCVQDTILESWNWPQLSTSQTSKQDEKVATLKTKKAWPTYTEKNISTKNYTFNCENNSKKKHSR